uniref:Ubiquitin-like protease family profile domain-containing protein n=1 Tax=viral metagenome TaxID=1070528 RepID=A0A6C0JE87_9ZZZZ
MGKRNISIRKNKKTKNKNKNKNYKGGRTIKKMNCSPMVDKKSPVKGSCFTEDVLQLLKQSYNKHHVNDPIESDSPNKIWSELKEKLKTCDKEDCWLDEIKDKRTRTKIDQYIFAPDHPDEWNKNPDEWLSNFDIDSVLQQYMETYKDFYAPPCSPIDYDVKPKEMKGNCVSNELCNFSLENHMKNGKRKFGIVFNLSPHTSGGSHWVSVYVDTVDKFIFYMDSAGNKIPGKIQDLVNTLTQQGLEMNPAIEFKYYENYPLEHQMGNTECGMFSLFFIISMLSNKADKKVFHSAAEKIGFFINRRIPDKYVFRFRKIYFNEK